MADSKRLYAAPTEETALPESWRALEQQIPQDYEILAE